MRSSRCSSMRSCRLCHWASWLRSCCGGCTPAASWWSQTADLLKNKINWRQVATINQFKRSQFSSSEYESAAGRAMAARRETRTNTVQVREGARRTSERYQVLQLLRPDGSLRSRL